MHEIHWIVNSGRRYSRKCPLILFGNTGNKREIKKAAERMESCKPGSIADLATLANLDGKVLLNELKVRYQENNIYVSKYILETGFLHLLESKGNDNFSVWVFLLFFFMLNRLLSSRVPHSFDIRYGRALLHYHYFF